MQLALRAACSPQALSTRRQRHTLLLLSTATSQRCLGGDYSPPSAALEGGSRAMSRQGLACDAIQLLPVAGVVGTWTKVLDRWSAVS